MYDTMSTIIWQHDVSFISNTLAVTYMYATVPASIFFVLKYVLYLHLARPEEEECSKNMRQMFFPFHRRGVQ
jgi:hypothetical protein